MKKIISLYFVFAALVLSGCAVHRQQPIDLATDAFSTNAGKIGVAMTALPKVDTFFPGADCLLCYAAASAANSSLTSHTKTLGYEDLPDLKVAVANILQKKGSSIVVIPEPVNLETLPDMDKSEPNVARKNYASFQKKYDIDKLIVIQIRSLGMTRTYSSYFPTSDPKATMDGVGFMVNLKDNRYEWYMPVSIAKSADGKWDESPNFPGLTNAYFQVIELTKDRFTKPVEQPSASPAGVAAVR